MKKIIEHDFYVRHKPALWREMLKAMKITAAIVLTAALHVSASGVAQKISFIGENVPISKVFNAIEDQLGYGVLMPHKLMEAAKPVTLKVEEGTLDEVLQKCFAFQPWKLTYFVQGHTLYISEQESQAVQPDLTGPGKSVNVSGIIYNEAGEPLAGANITIKETQKGTITDAQGQFKLTAVPLNSTLIVSYVGYASQQVKVKDESGIKLNLKQASNELDRAVVQAYGETTQRLATGDIGTVRAEDIARQPVMNVLTALQGQVPGAVVTSTSGYASAPIKVEIQGRNTINPAFPSDPLYIIDGVPLTVNELNGNSNYSSGDVGFAQSGVTSYAGGQNVLFSLNPADIESLQVLKDADATAIYGSRGANGVILITTKKGKPGKTHLEVTAYEGSTFITKQYPLMDTRQYIAMRKEALANDGLPIDANYAPDLVFGDSTRNVNWQKFSWGGMGPVLDAQASLTGGSTNTNLRLSAGYHYQRDVTAASGGNSRESLSFNINHKSADQRLKVMLSVGYTYALTNQIGLPSEPTMPPDAPDVFDKKGNLNFAGWDYYFATLNANPFSALLQPYTAGTNFLNGNLSLSFEILKGLVFRANLGYNNSIYSSKLTTPIASQEPAFNPTGSNSVGSVINYNLISEPQLEYNRYVGKGKLDLLAGASDQKNVTTGMTITASGFTNDALLDWFSSAPQQFETYIIQEYKYAGIFARAGYNWEDKYILNLNARRDGSSRFGPSRQYGNFGSAGAAWIFTEENFAKKYLSFLSFGKLRASYGLTGGDQIGNYQYLTQWGFLTRTYNGNLPLIPNKHTDSLFQWQVNKKGGAAVELSFFKDRLAIEVARYIDRCNNQLVNFPTPEFTGFTFVLTNTPANVQNTGWISTINGKIIESRNFRWTSRLMIGTNQNKLVSYPDLAQSPYAAFLEIGKSLNIRRVLHSTGVDPQTGLYTFEDKNKDGIITFAPTPSAIDDTYTYNMSAKFDGSLSMDFTYKRVRLNMLIYFRDQFGLSPLSTLGPAGGTTNQATEIISSHWQKPGDIATYAKYTTNPSDISWQYYYFQSDGTITDASFARLQNLVLSYSPNLADWHMKAIEDFQVLIKVENIAVLTKYKGPDPEIQNFGTLPIPKTVTASVSFKF